MTQTLESGPALTLTTAIDQRCDRCGAAAKARVLLTTGGELAFCGHHANRYSQHILATAHGVIIETGFGWRGTTHTNPDAG